MQSKSVKLKNILLVLVGTLLLIVGFQNCHNGVKYSEMPSSNGSLGASDDSGASGLPGTPGDESNPGMSTGSQGGSSANQPSGPSGDDQTNLQLGSEDNSTAGSGQEDGQSNPPSQVVEVPPAPVNPFVPAPSIGLLPINGEWSSIAYEDNITDGKAGDRDYNDAVFNYKISEQYNSANQLVRIFLEVRLREKISSNDHILHLLLNGNASPYFDNIAQASAATFNGEASAKITYADGSVTNIAEAKNKDLVIFKGTSNAKGKITKVTIELASPELNVNSAEQKYVNFLKYRFILQNKGQTKIGIDIAEINPSKEMLSNANGYPFGFMIPTDWQPPAEHQLIDDKYPSFYRYREWLSSPSYPIANDVLNWYL